MITYLALFLLGLFLLYTFSSSFSRTLVGAFSSSSTHQQAHIQELFFRTVFTLLGYIAKRDGAINKQEIKRTETYMEKMDLDTAHKREAIRLFKLGAEPTFDIADTIQQFQWLADKSPNLVQILLVYLINLARVDGLLVNKEIEAVQKIALGLGYANITFTHLLKMVSAQNKFEQQEKDIPASKSKPAERTATAQQPPSSRNSAPKKTCEEQVKDFEIRNDQLSAAYDVFDVSPKATDAEIKKAYRNLVNQYHPDKLIGLGLPPYMMQSANECFQKIQAAYEYIRNARA